MSTMESLYGVVGDGGIVQSNEDSGPQSHHTSGGSVGLMPNMRLAFSPDGAAVYRPLMPPTSPPHSASATPASGYPSVCDESTMAAAPPSITAAAVEQTRRKRGRPRKYGPDGTTDPLMVSMLQLQSEAAMQSSGLPAATAAALSVSSPPSGKKPRGRPPGSRRKQKIDALGSPAVGFTPHIITVKAGEDVSSKIMSFSQNSRGAICILSANGAISNVTLRQTSTSGGTVTYEGRFEILTLSGSYMLVESGGQRSRTGGLSVLLAGPDGRVLGGGVAGLLTAAAPVQVVLGCFIAGQEDLKSPNQYDPSTAAPAKLVPGASAAASPGSRGTLSESSGGLGSPLDHGTGNNINPQDMMTALSWK